MKAFILILLLSMSTAAQAEQLKRPPRYTVHHCGTLNTTGKKAWQKLSALDKAWWINTAPRQCWPKWFPDLIRYGDYDAAHKYGQQH